MWSLIPLGVVLFHFGYGQRLLCAEEALRLRLLAQSAERSENYKKAIQLYLAAENKAHTKDLTLRACLKIDAARALILAGGPLEAAEQLDLLLLSHTRKPLPENVVTEAKSTLATALYSAAYALRIETPSPKMWQSEIDEATHLFQDLYRSEIKTNAKTFASLYARNLEASILLARSRKGELASQPLPPAVRTALEQGVASKKNANVE